MPSFLSLFPVARRGVLALASALLVSYSPAVTVIEGQVFAADGVTPITNLRVNNLTQTDSEGRFSFETFTGTIVNVVGESTPAYGPLGVAAPEWFSGLPLYPSVVVEGTTVTMPAVRIPAFHAVTIATVSGGAPVPGASFSISKTVSTDATTHSVPAMGYSLSPTTDSNGEALVHLPAGRHEIYFTSVPGHERPLASPMLVVRGPGRIEHECAPHATISGTLTLADGTTPVEGVEVSAVDLGYQDWSWGGVVTDASGSYAFTAPARPLRFRLERTNYSGAGLTTLAASSLTITESATRTISSGSNTINLSLPAMGRLSGRMLADGATPRVGEVANVYTTARTSGGWGLTSWSYPATTGALGEFVADMPVGRARLHLVPGSGFRLHRFVEQITAGPLSRDYTVYSSGAIQLSGRVTDHLGNGVPLTISNGFDDTSSDSSGNWTLNTTRGAFALTASTNSIFGPPIALPDNFTYRFRDVELRTGNASGLDVTLPAPRTLTATIRVNGTALPYSDVSFYYHPDESVAGYGYGGFGGQFGTLSVTRFAGPYELLSPASGPGLHYAGSYTGNLTANSSITFDLPPAPAYVGTVRGSVGGPGLPGVRFAGVAPGTSASGGAYRIPVGNRWGQVYAEDTTGWTAPRGTPEDFRTDYFLPLAAIHSDAALDVVLPFVTLSGTITKGGVPVTNATIRATSLPDYSGSFATDSDAVSAGAYQLGLVEGVYTLVVESTNSAFESRVLYGHPVSANGTLDIELDALADPVLYVDDSAPGGGDGLTLGTALTNLPLAVAQAAAGTRIIVAPGTYIGSLTITRNVHLTSLDPSDPAVVASTLLMGQSNGSVVSFSGAASAGSIVEGFTILNGSAANGAGVSGDNRAVTVRNNIITRNHASGTVVMVSFPLGYTNGGTGAGVHGVAGAVVNNIIAQNTAAGGTTFVSLTGTPAEGVGIANCSGLVAHNLILGNSVTNGGTTSSLGAGAITGAFVNNIVWANGAGTQTASLSNARHNLIADYPSTPDSFGNFSADPLFADADGPDNNAKTWADNDFTTPLTSPVVDAGTNPASVYTALDILGISRPRDFAGVGLDNAPHLGFDIGPFEVASLEEQHNDPAGDSTHDYVGPRLLISYQGGSPSSTTVTLIPTNSLISNLTVGVAGTEIADAVWQIESDRTSFTATVTIRYLAAEIAGLSGSEANLRVYRASSLDGPWTELTTVLDTANNTATFTTTGFSVFTLAKEFEGSSVDGWELY